MSNIVHAVFGTSALKGEAAPSEGVIPPTLQAFYDRLGPLPEPKARPDPSFEAPNQQSLPPLDRDEGAMFLQDEFPGTDPVAHERDILYVVNYAMEHGKTRTQTDLAQWIQMQLAFAQREGQWTTDNKYKAAPPDILQLAAYLRRQEACRRR